MTLEQPIEYQLPLIRQTEIHEKGRLTFGEGIRSLLRQDPDILFVGEIRDLETAQMSLRASMTGHPVYTTLHAGDSFAVVQRLEDLGLKREDFLSHLTWVVNQRLIRIRCHHCTPPASCSWCKGTGYYGRRPIAEILVMDEEVRSLFQNRLPLSQIRTHVEKRGFLSLSDQAQYLLKESLTTPDEIFLTLGEIMGEIH